MALGTVRKNEVFRSRGKASSVLLWSLAAIAVFCGMPGAGAQTAASNQAPQIAGQGEVREFNIPAQPLASALATFNRQSGIQITQASGATARNIAVNAVRGSMTPRQALAEILSGTGIPYHFTSNRAAVIGAQQTVNGIATDDSSTTLAPIIITAKTNRNAASGPGYQGTPDWVYETPSSVSVISREAIQNAPTRTTRELFSGVAGVNVSSDNAQNPGTNVNIRGLQDQTRINTMIDGARQNFQRSAHGSSGQTYIDPSFIREVDIEKSGSSGVGGAATLGGSVNYRTLTADDLIEPGRDWGAELDVTTGTNAYHFAGSGSAAVRLSDSFSILGGISYKNIGEYEPGEHGANYNTVANPNTIDGSQVWSGLLKAEMAPTDDATLDLSWLRYKSEFIYSAASEGGLDDINDITNDTVTATFGWDPDSELIDLKARLWYNRTQDQEDRAARPAYGAASVTYEMQGIGGSLENTSRFTLPFADLALNYGIEAFRDDGDTSASGDLIDDDPWAAWWYQGANGSGTRDVVSGFANAKFEHDTWLTVDAGIRYDHYKISGTTGVITPARTIPGVCILWRPNGACARYSNSTTIPASLSEVDADLSGGGFSPTFGVTVTPTDGLQLFTKYSHSYRPPTITEAVIGGSHVGSYSAGTVFAPNPSIEPEEADTFEIGANFKYDDVFQSGDALRMKVVAFYREVDNYIAMGQIDLSANQTDYLAYVNLDGKTPMKGVELEASYDGGRYYIGGSFSYLDADYATNYTYNGTSNLTTSYILFVPPKTKFTLDGGVRFFEEKLTLGGRVTHVGAADGNIGGSLSGALVSTWQSGDYTLYDIYGSYKFNPKTTLRFAVNNVTNVRYMPALGQTSYPAPGRTATVSLNFKF
ncbi:hemoglobin/transferrin/lactoferrin receptor protein [Neorhizobium galegae]|uniref:TonB-dependent receptor n=1 Tax=Neorhizobium galegae TaxID=399 RepID=UPI002789CBBD|nr:TonB-dependent receptor [Neorhizobium galegae]MDQ0133794.1 hemoglobin/transferrin/lactoferrin receptor protein [Neorhizobium galegae]